MSQENVDIQNEVVRSWLTAFEEDTNSFRALLHPEIEWFPIEENHTGLSGIEAAVRNRGQWLDTWGDHHFAVEEVVEDGERVVVLVHIKARGKASGVAVGLRFYAQFTVRDGKVIRIFDHPDRSSALRAAGLGE